MKAKAEISAANSSPAQHNPAAFLSFPCVYRAQVQPFRSWMEISKSASYAGKKTKDGKSAHAHQLDAWARIFSVAENWGLETVRYYGWIPSRNSKRGRWLEDLRAAAKTCNNWEVARRRLNSLLVSRYAGWKGEIPRKRVGYCGNEYCPILKTDLTRLKNWKSAVDDESRLPGEPVTFDDGDELNRIRLGEMGCEENEHGLFLPGAGFRAERHRPPTCVVHDKEIGAAVLGEKNDVAAIEDVLGVEKASAEQLGVQEGCCRRSTALSRLTDSKMDHSYSATLPRCATPDSTQPPASTTKKYSEQLSVCMTRSRAPRKPHRSPHLKNATRLLVHRKRFRPTLPRPAKSESRLPPEHPTRRRNSLLSRNTAYPQWRSCNIHTTQLPGRGGMRRLFPTLHFGLGIRMSVAFKLALWISRPRSAQSWSLQRLSQHKRYEPLQRKAQRPKLSTNVNDDCCS